jgi:maleate isomerase
MIHLHSSRMRMTRVTAEELASMDAESDRRAVELSDARVDVLGYACLAAIMSAGPGYHRVAQERLRCRTTDTGHATPVVTSAGALALLSGEYAVSDPPAPVRT